MGGDEAGKFAGVLVTTTFVSKRGSSLLLTRNHTVHHKDDFDRNYASLTSLPDMLFGTYG